MSAAPALLEMRQITKEFPGVKALSDVSLTVRRGEVHAICGENGAGKSTLMKVLSGVYPHGTYDGDIVFEGEIVQFKDIRASERAGIVIIHQELALIPELSIAENIFLGNERARGGRIDWVGTNRRAIELLRHVGLREDPETPIKTIGVGKQQLVEIAKALNKDVKLLILDEPTAALNEEDSAHLLDLIEGLRERGITSIIISHKLNEIERIADSVTIIRDGRSIETLDVAAGGVDEDRIIKGMVGRSLESRFPEHTPRLGETFFEVQDWTVEHPQVAGRLVCKGSSFHVRRGEIVGFAGLMGAGRTELMRSIFGRSYGTLLGGRMILDGREVTLKNVSQAIDAGIGYVTEDRKVLGLNLLDDIKTTTTAARLKKIAKHLVVDRNAEFAAADGYRRSLRTKTPSVEEGVAKLSGGNQQKVVLAKWLFAEPELLILDEPTRGIDVGAKYEIYGIIQQLADAGKGVIVVSSELPELLGLSDRIYTICEGRITGELAKHEATQENLMRLMTTTGSAAGRAATPAAGSTGATAAR
ncbi:multiple monosaccharide ABC transporter ATP-binding protein [Agilicoccus flavus]|uniref:multiple monosaccharide ABC transporter ATP-binding protein n=1 Tax=Agilicoccus flavus TaxID=2775968 RepID=UPI001CF6D6C3|nr:multiple monosaccharide ABC transporter ATP-binding protein [Agilicoccus flavus]